MLVKTIQEQNQTHVRKLNQAPFLWSTLLVAWIAEACALIGVARRPRHVNWSQLKVDCKIKEGLLIGELKPTLNDNFSIVKVYLYNFASFICIFFSASVIVMPPH